MGKQLRTRGTKEFASIKWYIGRSTIVPSTSSRFRVPWAMSFFFQMTFSTTTQMAKSSLALVFLSIMTRVHGVVGLRGGLKRFCTLIIPGIMICTLDEETFLMIGSSLSLRRRDMATIPPFRNGGDPPQEDMIETTFTTAYNS
ncbi:hypothetical protein BKA65DRAFT_471364 [Rhexocercosporidium sp. MPI-PUGE-AT-0058]|nr:hypothetical protein BKA65DRAFT_471364 [Rhexocercosporidium sp. MPI-PUGE-AT-0058]